MIRGKLKKKIVRIGFESEKTRYKNIALENVKQISYMLPNLIKMYSFRKMT